MDPELFGIFMFAFSIIAFVFLMAHLFHRRVVRHEERKLELKARIAEAKAQEGSHNQDAVQMLEDRMRVVERIVTDPGADLSRQIEHLRHDRASQEETAS